jgi:hypothetical protein
MLRNLLTLTFAKRKVFVDQLEANCEPLMEISRLFRDRSKALELVSFYESTGIHGVGVFSFVALFTRI